MSFFAELKRRNVFRVGIAYLVGGWLLLQLTDVLSSLLDLPDVVGRVVVLALAIGFPIALFLAWAFELTPEGVKRDEDVDRSQSIAPQTGKKLNNTILALMALAIAFLLFDRFSSTNSLPVTGSTVEVAENDSAMEPDQAAEPQFSRQSIAVLPFDNRSRNVDDEYFTEGIHDDLLTNLSRISALKVISRTSVTRYKETEKSIPEIAKELGVANILEGAVQRSGNTVRINVQLIDAITDEHLWAEIFDREMTAENLFAIQSEISEKIASALEATLSPEEEQRINEFPTQNLEAYNAFMRGRQLLVQRNSKDLEQAMGFFERAVELDPNFALAWVGIAESAHLLGVHSTINHEERNRIMEAAVNQALAINPNSGEAYASKGNLHRNLDQPQQAEAAYKHAIELNPNYANTYHWYAVLISETYDRLQEAQELIKKAVELDPLSPILMQNIAASYGQTGRLLESEATYLKLASAYPEFAPGLGSMSWFLYTNDLGQLDNAIIRAQMSYEADPGRAIGLVTQIGLSLSLDDEARAQSIYQQMVEELHAGSHWLPWAKALLAIKNGRYAVAKQETALMMQRAKNPLALWEAGFIYAWVGDYDRARELLLKVEPRYTDREQWPDILNEGLEQACLVGLVLARTGDEALGNDLLRYAANYWQETLPQYIEHADRWPSYECYAYLGETEKALAALEIALDHGHALFEWLWIAQDPEWRLIHEDPRFKAMDQRARAELARQRENLVRMELEAGS